MAPAPSFGRAALAATLALCVTPASAPAQTQAQTFGSPLTAEPNLAIGCETMPALQNDGGTGRFAFVASGQPDCTWRQAGVFNAAPGDPRFSSVPADGRITRVEVRSGPNPGRLRFVVLRQLAAPGFGSNSQCCFFVSETTPVQPAPNTITTFALDLLVQRNTIDGAQAVDLVGFSGESGTGTLPLSSNGRNNAFQLTENGNSSTGFFYPRMGSIANDSGGGRREQAYPGSEALVRWTFCPTAGGRCAATTGGGGGGGGGQAGPGPALRSQAARVRDNRAAIALACNGDAACEGTLELINRGAVAAQAKVSSYGTAKYLLGSGANATVRLKLNEKGRRVLRSSKSKDVKFGLRIKPKGGATITSRITLRR